MNTTSTKSLVVDDLTVDFDGNIAVDGVTLELRPGCLNVFIGPNGAGKTTLIDALTGLTRTTRGQALLGDTNLLGMRPHQIARLGVGRTFQTATVFERMTVAQNLDIAGRPFRGWRELFRPRKGIPDYVDRALTDTGLAVLAGEQAGILSHGQRQWLEIGMLLVQQASVLLLDEPVAGMSSHEREETGEMLRRLARDRAVAVIEHDIDFVRQFADTVTVMHQGRILRRGSVDEIQNDQDVQNVYLGRRERACSA